MASVGRDYNKQLRREGINSIFRFSLKISKFLADFQAIVIPSHCSCLLLFLSSLAPTVSSKYDGVYCNLLNMPSLYVALHAELSSRQMQFKQ